MDSESTTPSEEDLEETFTLLQKALASLPSQPAERDQVPESVFEGSRWVHDWVNMDAELAQLTSDSLESDLFSSVRSASPLRQITFDTGERRIEIAIEPAPKGVSLTGTVTPAVAGTIRAVIGSVAYIGQVDDLGTFEIDNVSHGVVLAFIESSAATIRLGSFEV